MKKIDSKVGAAIIAKNVIASVAIVLLVLTGGVFGYGLISGDYDTSDLCNRIVDKDDKAICAIDTDANDSINYNLHLAITIVSLSMAVIIFVLLVNGCEKK